MTSASRFPILALSVALVTNAGGLSAAEAQSSKSKKNSAPGPLKAIERVVYPSEPVINGRTSPTLTLPQRPDAFRPSIAPGSAPEYKVPASVFAPVPESPLPSASANATPPGPLPQFGAFSLPNPKSVEDKLTPVQTWTPDQVRMFEAFMMLDDANKPLPAFGAFVSLVNSKSADRESVQWGLAHSALKLGLRLKYEDTLLTLMKKGSDKIKVRAFESLVANSDPDKSLWLQSLPVSFFQNPPSSKVSDAYLILKALRMSSEKELAQAIKDLDLVKPTSPLYPLRVYQEAIIRYRQGQLNLALQVLNEALDKKKVDFGSNKDLETRAKLLWGRLSFQSRDYNRAFEAYRSVPKTHPLWPEAMMEQALTQVLFQDFEGAAGNMFSLHTDFFKKSYSPDSYLIRAIGYLNLCQYADALQTVQDLQRKYKPIAAGVEAYNKTANPDSDLDVIRQFAKNPTVPEVRGIARPFLFAWAKDPAFDRHQSRINQVEDEMTLFKEVNLKMVTTEREAAQKIQELSGKIAAGPGKKDPENAVDRWKEELATVKVEHGLLNQARKSLQTLRAPYLEDMDSFKDERKVLAARALAAKRKAMAENLKHVLDQAEVLLYEIYNGAGDHLRFKAAGGETKDQKSVALKGLKENEVKWKFKGEIWEDELGHFRSSLTNVCGRETAEVKTEE